MTYKTVIIHGSYGYPERNWFPWLKKEIENLGHRAIVPRFPTPESQNFENWKAIFLAEAGQLDETTILIGHSVGAGFILSLLDDLSSSHERLASSATTQIRAAFLIAGFTGTLGLPDYDGINATFVGRPFNWQGIKKHCQDFYVINGADDPYVPLEKGRRIADSLSVTHELIARGGHLNQDAGFTTFPLLFDKVLSILKEPHS